MPDGSTIGLATQKEFADAGHVAALNRRAEVAAEVIAGEPAAFDSVVSAAARCIVFENASAFTEEI